MSEIGKEITFLGYFENDGIPYGIYCIEINGRYKLIIQSGDLLGGKK